MLDGTSGRNPWVAFKGTRIIRPSLGFAKNSDTGREKMR
jgi:hypothetical protein